MHACRAVRELSDRSAHQCHTLLWELLESSPVKNVSIDWRFINLCGRTIQTEEPVSGVLWTKTAYPSRSIEEQQEKVKCTELENYQQKFTATKSCCVVHHKTQIGICHQMVFLRTFQSPVWKIVPSVQRSTKPQQSGIECVTRIGSISNGPAEKRLRISNVRHRPSEGILYSFKRAFISWKKQKKTTQNRRS